jgi:hypothetical protein
LSALEREFHPPRGDADARDLRRAEVHRQRQRRGVGFGRDRPANLVEHEAERRLRDERVPTDAPLARLPERREEVRADEVRQLPTDADRGAADFRRAALAGDEQSEFVVRGVERERARLPPDRLRANATRGEVDADRARAVVNGRGLTGPEHRRV